MAAALDYAHRHGVVHRDIKPENILIHDGEPLITDFGIGKALRAAGGDDLTRVDSFIGTAAYMSPEQIAGNVDVDGRSDLYSLGCILYEMLTGERLHGGSTPIAVIGLRLSDAKEQKGFDDTTISLDLQPLLVRLLAESPDDRFASGAELAEALGTARQDTSPSPDKAIAVLPFANMSPDPENEYFSDGITEEIINALTQLEDLHVAARTSCFAFKAKTPDVREVGARLQVSSVLEGSVRKAGNRIRITVQLVNVADGYHLWSERYDRELDDVFAIQDEIATTIADRLKVTLGVDDDRPLVQPGTQQLDAYQLYLKGRYLWNKRTKADLLEAIGFFEQAIELDPEYALAYSGLADTYLILGSYRHVTRDEARSRATGAAKKAVALDDTLAEAHTSLGQVMRLTREWWSEEQEYRKALALNPSYATAHQWYSTLLAALGRLDEALTHGRRAVSLDPLSPGAVVSLAGIYVLRRDFDEAIAQCENALELNPGFLSPHAWLSRVYDAQGRHGHAVEQMQLLWDSKPDNPDFKAAMAALIARAGRTDEARSLLAEATAGQADPGLLGSAHLALGDLDAAVSSVERGIDQHSWGVLNLKCHPQFDALRADPRYDALLDRMGLP